MSYSVSGLNNLQVNTTTDIDNLCVKHFPNATVINNSNNVNNYYNDFISTSNDQISISISNVNTFAAS